jgi:hypothetical protein
MLFCMGTWKKRFIWSNLLGLLLEGHSSVCKLKKFLYGLKQSPRAWFGQLSKVLQQLGMTRCESDHSIFLKCSSSNKYIYLVVYVDDIVITCDDYEGIKALKQHLFQNIQTTDLGPLSYFLGIEVAQSNSSIAISQRK